MHTQLGLTFLYFSTTLMRSPNRRPDIHNFFAFVFASTIITIADPCILLVIYASLSQFSLINYCRTIFCYTPIDNSTSYFKSSIYYLFRYLLRSIPYTFNRCQCSNISTPTMTSLTVFTIQISTFDNHGINYSIFVCLLSKAVLILIRHILLG